MRLRHLVVAVTAAGIVTAPVVVAPAARASTCEVAAPGGDAVCAGFFAVMNLSCKVAGKVISDASCWA